MLMIVNAVFCRRCISEEPLPDGRPVCAGFFEFLDEALP